MPKINSMEMLVSIISSNLKLNNTQKNKLLKDLNNAKNLNTRKKVINNLYKQEPKRPKRKRNNNN